MAGNGGGERKGKEFFFFVYLYFGWPRMWGLIFILFFLFVCCLEDLEYWNGSNQNRFYIIAALCGDKKSKGIQVLKFLKMCLCT